MKQGKVYNKIIIALVIAVIVCYGAYSVFSAVNAPLTTVQAAEYEAGNGCRVTGFVVRQETVLTSPQAITVLTRAEGEKVGVGQTVATGYLTADAQARQNEMEILTAQLEQLEYAGSLSEDPASTAALDEQILSQLGTCAQLTAKRDMASIAEMRTALKGLILRRSTGSEDLSAIRAQADAIRTQLTDLQTVAGADTAQVRAPISGYFSGSVDGYESVLTPARLTDLTAAQLEALAPVEAPAGACGRLISDATWYFAAAVPAEQTESLRVGAEVSVDFSGDFYDTLTMTVTRVGEAEGDVRLLVLASSDYIQDVTLLRRQSADILFNVYAGLRVPKDALRVDEQGRAGVFVLESVTSKWKPVNILYDNGESYVVELDKSSTDNLWPGDVIIVEARNLYDGKVVIQS